MDLNEALEYFLEVRTGDLRADIIGALREAARRRKEGPAATAAVVIAAHEQLGMSFRDIEAASYHIHSNARISQATAQRMGGGQE